MFIFRLTQLGQIEQVADSYFLLWRCEIEYLNCISDTDCLICILRNVRYNNFDIIFFTKNVAYRLHRLHMTYFLCRR